VEQSRADAAAEPDTERRVEPKLDAHDLDGFRRKLRQVLKWELRRWRPIARDPAWKRRWDQRFAKQLEPAQKQMESARKTEQAREAESLYFALFSQLQQEAEDEVERWREAEGSWEDLLERLVKPLVWLGTRHLERAAPRDRQHMAEEFICFATRPDVTGRLFLERELASLNLRQLGPLYRLLLRGGQEWFERRLTEGLETEIRRMHLPPLLSKTRAGRRIRAALLSEQGEALRKLLREVGLSQAAWAKAAGLHPSAISHWIRGKPLDANNLRRLIEVLEKKLTSKSNGHPRSARPSPKRDKHPQ
jgi:hypothetical protein